MEMACPGAPGLAVGQQKELAKAKEKTQAMGKKESSINKLEAVEKSPVFCGKWEILNDVITKGTAKDGSEGGLAAISIIAQAECKGPGLGLVAGWAGVWVCRQVQSSCKGGCAQVRLRTPVEKGGQGDCYEIPTSHNLGIKLRMSVTREL